MTDILTVIFSVLGLIVFLVIGTGGRIIKIMNFKFWKPKPEVRAEIRTVIANDLTVSRWREIPALVTETQKILANPSFKAMLEVLKNDAPHNYGMATAGAQPMEYAKKLGENDGYLICLNNLEAMAKPLEKNEMPEATFEQPEKE